MWTEVGNRLRVKKGKMFPFFKSDLVTYFTSIRCDYWAQIKTHKDWEKMFANYVSDPSEIDKKMSIMFNIHYKDPLQLKFECFEDVLPAISFMMEDTY